MKLRIPLVIMTIGLILALLLRNRFKALERFVWR